MKKNIILILAFLLILSASAWSQDDNVKGRGEITIPPIFLKIGIGIVVIFVLLYIKGLISKKKALKSHKKKKEERLKDKKKVEYKYKG